MTSTTGTAEFYLFLPQMRLSFDQIVERGRAAEDSGFTGMALIDHMVPPLAVQHTIHEAFVSAAALACATRTLRIGHLVLCDSFRHPVLLAREALSLDQLSGGRFDLGIGSGSFLPEFDMFGFDRLSGPDRVRRLDETLQVVRALWTGETVDFDGEFHHLTSAALAPVPLSTIPVLVGGSGPRTMDVVARHADWWNVPVHQLHRLDDMRGRAGRARVSLQQMVALVPDESERAQVTELAERRFPGYGSGLVVGNADELAELFAGMAAKGVERFYVWFADFAPKPTLIRFGEQVISRFSAPV
jgi:alkanesulfonate monooxygenase SsuD/methylene tetrahydromethanopterin reductase-like flavin-dependent oxidoreductase (luciferase family)